MQPIAQIYVFLLVYAIQENTAVNLKLKLKKDVHWLEKLLLRTFSMASLS